MKKKMERSYGEGGVKEGKVKGRSYREGTVEVVYGHVLRLREENL